MKKLVLIFFSILISILSFSQGDANYRRLSADDILTREKLIVKDGADTSLYWDQDTNTLIIYDTTRFKYWPMIPGGTPPNDSSIASKKWVLDEITAGGGYTDNDATDAVGAILNDDEVEWTYVSNTSITGKLDIIGRTLETGIAAADMLMYYDATATANRNISFASFESRLDHGNLASTGSNTHAQIDTHISNSALHFTEGSIDHTSITNIGTNSHVDIDNHIGTSNIHYLQSGITETGTIVTGVWEGTAIQKDFLDTVWVFSIYDWDTLSANSLDLEEDNFNLNGDWIHHGDLTANKTLILDTTGMMDDVHMYQDLEVDGVSTFGTLKAYGNLGISAPPLKIGGTVGNPYRVPFLGLQSFPVTNLIEFWGWKTTAGVTPMVGLFNNYQYYGDTLEIYGFPSTLIGSRCANKIHYLANTHIFGIKNAIGTTYDSLILENVNIFGAYNLYEPENGALDTNNKIDYANIFGAYNGAALITGSRNVMLIGHELMDLADRPYYQDYDDALNYYTAIGQRGPTDGAKTREVEGTIQMYSGEDSASWIDLVSDRILVNGIDWGGGEWGTNDTTVFISTKDVVINGTVVDSTEVLRVNGDIRLEGTIYGPYIRPPADSSIYFGKGIEVADTLSIYTQFVAGEALTAGNAVYIAPDSLLYKSTNNVDSAAKVHYIVYEDCLIDESAKAVLPSSFIKSTSWTWWPGSYIYLSTTGSLTTTAPTASGSWVVELGWATTEETINFHPTTRVKNL